MGYMGIKLIWRCGDALSMSIKGEELRIASSKVGGPTTKKQKKF